MNASFQADDCYHEDTSRDPTQYIRYGRQYEFNNCSLIGSEAGLLLHNMPLIDE